MCLHQAPAIGSDRTGIITYAGSALFTGKKKRNHDDGKKKQCFHKKLYSKGTILECYFYPRKHPFLHSFIGSMTKEEQEKIDEINAKYSDWLLTKYQDFGQFNHSDLKQEQNIQISPID